MNDFEHKEYFDARFCFKGDEKKLAFVLDSYAQKKTDLEDINSLMELYQTNVFFDKVNMIPSWTKEQYDFYKTVAGKAMKDVWHFLNSIDEDNIIDVYRECYVSFKDCFWLLFCKSKSYEKFNRDRFQAVFKEMSISPYKLLGDKAFVSFFDNELTVFLKSYVWSAKILVEYYLEDHKNPMTIFLPNSLTPAIKYQIMDSYIDNGNFDGKILDLIVNGKSSKDFSIDDKLRYKAKKAIKSFLNNPNVHLITHEYDIGVSLGRDLPEKSVIIENDKIVAEYNAKWIEDNLDYPTLLNNFIYLFEYTDDNMRCSFVSLSSQREALEEAIFITNGKTMYKFGHAFSLLNNLSDAQMGCYKTFLESKGIYIEEIVKWFFEEYLVQEFYIKGFVCQMPQAQDSLLSKYGRVASVMDGIKKQFKMLCEEGKIDREFFEISSTPVRYKEIPSLIRNKYGYCNSNDLKREMFMIFSNQSMLSYIERTKGKYPTLLELVLKEKTTKNDYDERQKEDLEWLQKRGSILVREDDVYCFNLERLYILWDLYHKEVLCLQYYKSKILNQLIADGEICIESKLLSRPENQYFDYCLNKAEFTNGLDLRNKYIHDTATLDREKQNHDYLVLLKLMIILIIKINEEFCLREKIVEGGDYYEI